MSKSPRPAGSRVLLLLLVAALPIAVLTLQPSWLSSLSYAVEVGQARASRAELSTAANLSEAFRHVARVVRPSVVSISSVRHVQPAASGSSPFGSQVPEELRGFFDEEMLKRFGQSPRSRGYEQRGLGSGVIVSDDGYILTNNHVVGQADEVDVTLSDERTFRAEIIGTDASTDLAVLKIDVANLEPAALGSSDALEVGDWVLAMGSPFGLDQTVTAGIISAKSRANVGITDYEDFIQTDAAINPGNSGGPLVNLRGEVVGINTAIASRSGGYMGIGFAIPSEMVRHVMTSIIADGHVTRGWLGAMIQDLNEELAQSFDYNSTHGVLIGDLVPDGPAASSGLQPGDIVVRYADEPVETANELRNLVAGTTPGQTATLEVFRNGQTVNVDVEVGLLDQEQLRVAKNKEETTTELGVSVKTLNSELARQLNLPGETQGVVITQVEPGSHAARAGLAPKDVIVAVGNVEIENAAQFRQLLSEQDVETGIRLQVLRDGFRRFVVISQR